MAWSTGVIESFFSNYNNFRNLNMDSVIEYGSQDLNENFDVTSSVFDKFNVSYDRDTLMKSCDVAGKKSAKVMFSSLGYTKYDCIDLNGEHGALQMNLNEDLLQTYGFKSQYDLVTNCGATEHCFDQAGAIKNMHNLCKAGGLMYYVIPCYGSDDHGFFHVNPRLFFTMAKANGYTIENLDFLMFDVDAYDYRRFKGFYELESAKEEFLLLDSNRPIYIAIVLRKNSDFDFVTPIDDFDDGEEKCIKSDIYKSFLGKNINNVAIFGSKMAAKIANDFCVKAKINVCFYVDDFETGFIGETPIISFEDFIKVQQSVDVILVGPRQAGADTLRHRNGLTTKIERIVTHYN